MRGCLAGIFGLASLICLGIMCVAIYGCAQHERGAGSAAVFLFVGAMIFGAIAGKLSDEGSGKRLKNPVQLKVGGSGCILPALAVMLMFVIGYQLAT